MSVPTILGAKTTSGGGSFLKHPIGAQAIGSGGAYASLAKGSFAQYWNPACISLSDRTFVGTNFNLIDANNYLIATSFVPKAELNRINWGIMLRGLFYDGIDKYDALGNKTGQVMYASQCVDFGASTNLMEDIIFLGVNLKFIKEAVVNEFAYGTGIDIGILFKLPYLRVGMVLVNVPTIEKCSTQSDCYTLDPYMRSSISYAEASIVLSVGFEKYISTHDDTTWFMGTGIKLYHDDNKPFDHDWLINAGFYDGNFTFGTTLVFYSFKFDYAVRLATDVETYPSHFFTLSYMYK